MNRAEEVAEKLEWVRAWLDHCDLDAVLISSAGGFAWTTGGGDNTITVSEEAGAASVLVTREDAYLLAPNNDLRHVRDEQVVGAGLTPVEWPWHEPDGEGRLVERLCDPARAVSDLGRLGLPVAPSDLTGLRFTLLPPELDRYRALGADVTEAMEVTVLAARPGDRECDVAARLAYECRRRDVVPVVSLVGTDDRIAHYRHPLPTARQLAHTLMVSVTGRRYGLHASLTRMSHHAGGGGGPGRGGGADGGGGADVARRHAAVIRVDARLIVESQSGALLGEVFERGVEQYGREGFEQEWAAHHQGGLTGYAGREVFATGASHHRLRGSQAVAWNPTIAGAKSEDTVLIGADGREVLTCSSAWPQQWVELAAGAVARPALLVR